VVAISDLSRLECRVRPLREGRRDVLAAYDTFFGAAGLVVVPLSPAVVDRATVLRARHGLRTPDALQAACCLALDGSARFVTNDAAFRRVAGMQVELI
jgi:predicted nucleic acid-binding protein